MIKLNDIHSLTDFQRNTKDHLRRLKATGRPEALTVNGEAEVVVQSAASFQKMADDLELLETLKSIQRGLDQAKKRKGRPMRDFVRELALEHGVELPG